MNILKRLLFSLFLILIILPVFQSHTGYFVIKPLKGVFTATSSPVFNDSLWFAGSFQQQYTAHVKDSVGFHNVLVRLFNQIDYSMFNLSHAGNTIVGINDYLFEYQYIAEYFGRNFKGEKYCNEKVVQLKKLQERLWKENKIFLLVIFTPDKGTFYPEKIPARYMKKPPGISNYAYYARKCTESGINVIDFNEWFRLARDTSRYLLYPKTGIHWTSYGAMLAADSLIKYLQARLNLRLPEMRVDSIEISKIARDEDNDLGRIMNLICDIPYPAYAYPKVHFVSDSTSKKPSALFVGDSFYFGWYFPGYIKNIFSNEEFWYYAKDVYPETFSKPLIRDQIDVRKAVERQDIIVLIQTNGAFGNPGYGFADWVSDELDAPRQENLTEK